MNVVCYDHNETRHISRFYKKPWKKWDNPTKKRDKKNAQIVILDANLFTWGNVIDEKVFGDKVLQEFEDTLVLSVEVDRHDWFINSSASKHVTINKYCFSFLCKAKGPINIRSTSGQSHPVKGKANVSIRFNYGEIK
jgi:hypothetical protein